MSNAESPMEVLQGDLDVLNHKLTNLITTFQNKYPGIELELDLECSESYLQTYTITFVRVSATIRSSTMNRRVKYRENTQ